MGKRYYCDYCDKSFADGVQNRKKHMQGGQHQSQMKLHYLAFRDPEEVLAEESTKRPCQRFNRGECTFGGNCRFSHMTVERRRELTAEIQRRKRQELEKSRLRDEADSAVPNEPTVEDWLDKRSKQNGTGDKARPKTAGGPVGDGTAQDSKVVYTLPPALQGIPDLPPSLVPPTAECLARAKDVEWG